MKPVSRVLVVIGFFLGILALVLVYVVFSSGHYDVFTLVILGVAGLMLFLRPVRGVRWGALVALAVGLLASYYVYNTFQVTTTVLIIVFVAATLLLYLLFKFAEDLLGIIGGILSFPPIAVIIGIPAATVRSRLNRAHQAMRAVLDADARIPGASRSLA